ncbi:MAG: SprB repeat-containing protein [Saprospiraceae bacterium]|nr:SprB repeat-containing protein [Saprospiraceae bacterium]
MLQNPSYVWSNGQTTATITGLNAGTYTVTVTNTTNSCTNTCSAIVVSSTSPPSISCTPTQPTCAAPNGGSVSTSVTGGISPFTYLWSNGVTASIISNVGAGTYTVTVTDNNNCTASCSAVLNAPVGCCEINNLNLVIGNCDNKGTLTIASDDEYTFTLNPTGNGIGTTYTVSGLPNSPQTGTYGSPTTFGPYLISAGVLNITVVDNVSNTCSKSASVSPPPSCSVCNVAPPVLTVTDNICPSRTGTINLVQGCGAGTFIQYSINNGTSWSSVKPFYSTTSRTILARCVNSTDTTCKSLNTTVTTAPKKCPTDGSECSLIANATIDPCNNNGTDNISTDDYFTIQVSATVANGGSSNKYEVVIGADPLTGTGGNVLNSGGTNYGSPVTIGNTKIFLADGTSTYQLVIRDINNNNCFQIINIDPVASCSNAPPKSPCYPVPCVPIGLIKN